MGQIRSSVRLHNLHNTKKGKTKKYTSPRFRIIIPGRVQQTTTSISSQSLRISAK